MTRQSIPLNDVNNGFGGHAINPRTQNRTLWDSKSKLLISGHSVFNNYTLYYTGEIRPQPINVQKNNSILAKQNDTVLKLIHEISANVNEMNERVNILKQKLCTLINSVNKNKENVTAINRKLLKLENAVNIIKTDYKKFGRQIC